MLELDWNLVRTFVTVAEQGSLTAAARVLGLAHPTVARHVQQLEGALKMTLFHRRASGLALNDAGRGLAEAARNMAAGARAFELASTAVRANGSGRVRITTSEFLADACAELLAPLRRAEQQNLISIDLLITGEQLNLLEGEADIAIRHSEPRQQDLVCRRLASLPFGLYASRSYLEERGVPTPDNLCDHWFIDGIRTPQIARHARRLGITLGREQLVFRSDSFAGRLHGAAAGWGITAAPAHLARAKPELVSVLAELPVSRLEMWLVARPDVRTTAYLSETFTSVGDMLNAFVATLTMPVEPAVGTAAQARSRACPSHRASA